MPDSGGGLAESEVSTGFAADKWRDSMDLKDFPEDLRPAYTMDGEIPLFPHYFEPMKTGGRGPNWTTPFLDDYFSRFSAASISAGKQGRETYPGAAAEHCAAFSAFPVRGANVAVVGSQAPWIEGIAHDFGASKITTVEYNVPTCVDPRLSCMAYVDFEKLTATFDAIVSYSSIEHSGLGRYGDPLDPDGDLIAAQAIRERLKLGGLLYLGVPIGPDAVCWNAHRIYGYKRLPRLTEGFNLLQWFGPSEDFCLKTPRNIGWFRQPILVMRKV